MQPVIDVTDLYHPHQDPGDNLDLILPYALREEIDLRAVILDCTDAFRKPVAEPYHAGLWPDAHGPREPGIIPVTQLNHIFHRNVAFGVGPWRPMRSVDDPCLDAPPIQQSGIELILRTLHDSATPVDIAIFSSCRPVAAALNRAPDLFAKKCRRIVMSAGSDDPAYLEWNVCLDIHAFVRLMRSDLPIDLIPCATRGGPFAYSRHNSFWELPNLDWLVDLHPRLRRYMLYCLSRSSRVDFLRAVDAPWADEDHSDLYARHDGPTHKVWETAIWMELTGRKLVRRADGRHRLLPPAKVRVDDTPLPHALLPCDWTIDDDGRAQITIGASSARRRIYDRVDPLANERALNDALPALYRSFIVGEEI